MTRLYVAVASNHEPLANIVEALTHLSKTTRLVAVSTFYETNDRGGLNAPRFTNGVVAFDSSLRTTVVRARLLRSIEHALGRSPQTDLGAYVPMDLDLLLAQSDRGSPIGSAHRDVHERAYAALPLVEVAGNIEIGIGERLGAIAGRFSVEGMTRLDEFSDLLRQRFLNTSSASLDSAGPHLKMDH